MPAGSHAVKRGARPAPRSRPRRPSSQIPAAAAAARVPWERLGRVAMLFVLVSLAYLYVSAGVRMFSTWRQSHRDSAIVSRLQAEHRQLVTRHNTLSSQGALEAEARQLGMIKQGEQAYVVTHLPAN